MRRGIGRLRAGGNNFSPQSLFSNGEPGAHFETYNPDALCSRRNQLTYSSKFANAAWAQTNILSVTTKADGTGDLVVPNTTAGAHTLAEANCSVGEQNTATVRAAPSGYSFVYVTLGTVSAWVNVTTGALGTVGAGLAASTPVAVGSGYYEFSVSGIPSSTNFAVGVSAADNTASFAGNGTSGVYLARAQLEWNTTTPSAYQDVTDWNTEYLAAVGSANVGMWQDSAGTLAVYGIEQPVGKWIDKSGRGNHATQATASARPVLSARYNVLTKTEQVDSAWVFGGNTPTFTKGATDPLGGSTAFTLTASAAGGCQVYQTTSVSAKYTNSVWVRRRAGIGAVQLFDGSTNQPLALTSAWQLFTIPGAGATTFVMNFIVTSANDAIDFWHPDARLNDDAAKSALPAYQRVNTSTDYDTDGFIHYLKYDGVNDGLQTAAINFSTGDKMTVWAGVTKLSDAAAGIAAELTATASATNGGFYVAGPSSAAANFGTANRGTTTTTAGSVAGFTSPVSAVLTAQFDNAAATSALQNILRENGTQQTLTFATGPTSGGNFANDILNIGGRNNSISAPYNGRMTSLTVRGSTTPSSTAFIQKMEQYAAKLAGLSFVSS